MRHRSILWRGRVAGLVGALLAAVALFVVGPAATPALADTTEPTLFDERNSSDPEIQQCSDQATGWSGLCMFTSSDLGTHAPSFDWVYPMEKTYLYTLTAGLDASIPSNWVDRGAIFSESQIPWAARYPDGTLAQHLWAPTHVFFQGYHYLFVPEITDVTQVHTSSRIAIARSQSLFGDPVPGQPELRRYDYLSYHDIDGYASDPAIFFRPPMYRGEPPTGVPYLVYADGDGDNCGGLKIARLFDQDLTMVGTPHQSVTITGLADAFGTSGAGCAAKGRPYLEGAALYWFTSAETGSSSTWGDYYLVFAVKPEGGYHGASNEVIAYATASDVLGPYTYRGVIMEGSSSEWTNQASIQKYGDRYIFAYHDGTPTNGLPARKVRGACLTFQQGRINPIQRTSDGFRRCNDIGGTVALRSIGNGKVVVAGNAGAADLTASSPHIGGWEKFDFIPRNGGRFALRAHANGRYVSANHPLGALRADATSIGFYEEYALRLNANGSVSVLNPFGEPIGPMNPSNTLIHAYAPKSGPNYGPEFEIVPLDGITGLRSRANGQFVVALDGVNAPLVAAGGTGTEQWWESLVKFEHQSDGYTALKWTLPGRYVHVAGDLQLLPNSSSVGSSDEFLLVWNTDGTFSLKARINDRFVAAHPDGVTPLVADRTEIHPAEWSWEKFDLVDYYGLVW